MVVVFVVVVASGKLGREIFGSLLGKYVLDTKYELLLVKSTSVRPPQSPFPTIFSVLGNGCSVIVLFRVR